MTKWILGLALAAALLLAPVAEAHTTIIEPMGSRFPYQRWIDESLVPTPDVTIEVIPTELSHGCPSREASYPACTSPELNTIWFDEAAFALFPATGGMRNVRHVFMHEIGHNFDQDVLPEWARGWFEEIYGLEGPWSTDVEPRSATAPNELFAEDYASCSFEPYITKQEMIETDGAPIAGTEPIFGFRAAYNKVCRMLRNL
jgi:hypothetical protein